MTHATTNSPSPASSRSSSRLRRRRRRWRRLSSVDSLRAAPREVIEGPSLLTEMPPEVLRLIISFTLETPVPHCHYATEEVDPASAGFFANPILQLNHEIRHAALDYIAKTWMWIDLRSVSERHLSIMRGALWHGVAAPPSWRQVLPAPLPTISFEMSDEGARRRPRKSGLLLTDALIMYHYHVLLLLFFEVENDWPLRLTIRHSSLSQRLLSQFSNDFRIAGKGSVDYNFVRFWRSNGFPRRSNFINLSEARRLAHDLMRWSDVLEITLEQAQDFIVMHHNLDKARWTLLYRGLDYTNIANVVTDPRHWSWDMLDENKMTLRWATEEDTIPQRLVTLKLLHTLEILAGLAFAHFCTKYGRGWTRNHATIFNNGKRRWGYRPFSRYIGLTDTETAQVHYVRAITSVAKLLSGHDTPHLRKRGYGEAISHLRFACELDPTNSIYTARLLEYEDFCQQKWSRPDTSFRARDIGSSAQHTDETGVTITYRRSEDMFDEWEDELVPHLAKAQQMSAQALTFKTLERVFWDSEATRSGINSHHYQQPGDRDDYDTQSIVDIDALLQGTNNHNNHHNHDHNNNNNNTIHINPPPPPPPQNNFIDLEEFIDVVPTTGNHNPPPPLSVSYHSGGSQHSYGYAPQSPAYPPSIGSLVLNPVDQVEVSPAPSPFPGQVQPAFGTTPPGSPPAMSVFLEPAVALQVTTLDAQAAGSDVPVQVEEVTTPQNAALSPTEELMPDPESPLSPPSFWGSASESESEQEGIADADHDSNADND